MIPRLFATFATILLATLTAQEAVAQQRAKPLKAGDVLSGQLTAMRSGPRKKRVITYQLASEPRLLPPPAGLCNLETGPETFQIVTHNDVEVAALKPYIGKRIALRANELSCANVAGQLSDAIISKWSVMTAH